MTIHSTAFQRAMEASFLTAGMVVQLDLNVTILR